MTGRVLDGVRLPVEDAGRVTSGLAPVRCREPVAAALARQSCLHHS